MDILNESQMQELIERYYAGEKVNDLKKEFGLKMTGIYKIFPPQKIKDTFCDFCGTQIELKYGNRSDKKHWQGLDFYYCPNCGHRPYKKRCTCEHCKERRTEEAAIKNKILNETFPTPETPWAFDELDFKSRVYLGAFMSNYQVPDKLLLKQRRYGGPYAAPSIEFEEAMWHYLLENNVIFYSPESPKRAFAFDDELNLISVNYDLMQFGLNIEVPSGNPQDLIQKIKNPTWFGAEFGKDAYDMWIEIGSAQCLAYLEYQFKKVGILTDMPPKAQRLAPELLKYYSVGQLIMMIWKAVGYGTRKARESYMTTEKEVNTAIKYWENLAEKLMPVREDVLPYQRPFPESSLSTYFFTNLMQIGDEGFTRVPFEPFNVKPKFSLEMFEF